MLVGTDTDGAAVILVSALSAHTKALEADPRVSLLAGEPGRWIVFAVTGIGHADENEIKPEQRVGFLKAQASRVGDEDAIATGKVERKRMKITIAEDRL